LWFYHEPWTYFIPYQAIPPLEVRPIRDLIPYPRMPVPLPTPRPLRPPRYVEPWIPYRPIVPYRPDAVSAPDLVPVNRFGGVGTGFAPPWLELDENYCNRDPNTGDLLVRVRNQGNVSTQRTTITRVQVMGEWGSSFQRQDQVTPVLGPGEEVTLRFQVRVGRSPFRIIVDATNLLTEERNKVNNEVRGFCR
jgi:hypothetical protein